MKTSSDGIDVVILKVEIEKREILCKMYNLERVKCNWKQTVQIETEREASLVELGINRQLIVFSDPLNDDLVFQVCVKMEILVNKAASTCTTWCTSATVVTASISTAMATTA